MKTINLEEKVDVEKMGGGCLWQHSQRRFRV